MSTDLEVKSLSGAFAKKIDPLLKESAQRLREAIAVVVSRADDIAKLNESGTSRRRITDELFRLEQVCLQNMLPGIERLIRQTSQQLEHGSIDEISRILLEAHLAELEGLLSTANQALFIQTQNHP